MKITIKTGVWATIVAEAIFEVLPIQNIGLFRVPDIKKEKVVVAAVGHEQAV